MKPYGVKHIGDVCGYGCCFYGCGSEGQEKNGTHATQTMDCLRRTVKRRERREAKEEIRKELDTE